MATPEGSKAKRRQDKTVGRVRVHPGIRLKGSAERERVRAMKARDARLRQSEKSTSHGASIATERRDATPVPTPSHSSGCVHESTHAHREKVRLALQAGPARKAKPARETMNPLETGPAREARPTREAMHTPEGGYADDGCTGRGTSCTCEAGHSRASGRTREVRKSHCHVFLGGLDPGQAPFKTLLLMLRLT